MRVRIVTSALGLALAAGCSGGHGTVPRPHAPARRGVFSARVVTVSRVRSRGRPTQPARRILVDAATGAFRVSLRLAATRFGVVSVSAGETGTQVWGPRARPHITAYHGSPRFLANQLGGPALRVVQAFLAGSAAPSGVRVRVVAAGSHAILVATTATERMRITIARARRIPPAAFRPARGRPAQVVRELHPGERPGHGIAAYWLGTRWDGHGARSSSAETGRGGYYAVGYPHLSVVVMTSTDALSSGRPVTLGDGTHATLRVASVRADGSVSLSSSRSDGGTTILGDILYTNTGSRPGGTMAFVFLPHALITLSGTAVTPRSAAAIARSLRPL